MNISVNSLFRKCITDIEKLTSNSPVKYNFQVTSFFCLLTCNPLQSFWKHQCRNEKYPEIIKLFHFNTPQMLNFLLNINTLFIIHLYKPGLKFYLIPFNPKYLR